MKNIGILFLCLCMGGCVTIITDPGGSLRQLETDIKPLTNIQQVRIGMTYSEVAGIMGDNVNVGYQKSDVLEGAYKTIPVKNPYREEMLEGEKTTYRVVYYFTHIQKADGIVTDDELTPLVFEHDQLIGKGRNFLFTLKDNLK